MLWIFRCLSLILTLSFRIQNGHLMCLSQFNVRWWWNAPKSLFAAQHSALAIPAFLWFQASQVKVFLLLTCVFYLVFCWLPHIWRHEQKHVLPTWSPWSLQSSPFHHWTHDTSYVGLGPKPTTLRYGGWKGKLIKPESCMEYTFNVNYEDIRRYQAFHHHTVFKKTGSFFTQHFQGTCPGWILGQLRHCRATSFWSHTLSFHLSTSLKAIETNQLLWAICVFGILTAERRLHTKRTL